MAQWEYTPYQSKEYQESDEVKRRRQQLQQAEASKPGAYQSQWQAQQQEWMDKILNRKDFSYDMAKDPLFRQYKDQYVRQGKLGMMDTMGQAAALTGGYGSSYGQSVGQQTYQGYLQQLNDKVPELYSLALQKYDQDGQRLAQQYGIITDREATDYNRWQDQQSAWQADRNYAASQYENERNVDYSRYGDQADRSWNQYNADRSMAWQAYNTRREQALGECSVLMQRGIYPSDELIKEAGLSPEYVKLAMESNAAMFGGDDDGDWSPTPQTVYKPPNTQGELNKEIGAYRQMAAEQGMDKDETQKNVNLIAGDYYQRKGKYA